jgi:putative ABC transport system ATP-binding protein
LSLFDSLNASGRTIIMVTHDENVASHAKRVLRTLDGLIVSDGPPQRGGSLLMKS